MSDRGHTRRRALALLAGGAGGAVAAGLARRHVGGTGGGTAAASDVSATPTTTGPAPATTVPPPPPTTTTTVAPAAFAPYQTVEGEVFADAKAVAAAVVEALTTYGFDEPADATVARALVHAAPAVDAALVQERARPVLHPGLASAGRVVYPQLGGLDPHRAPVSCSVMVVVDQALVDRGGAQRAESRCLDVRLRVVEGRWRLAGMEDASPDPVERPAGLSDAAGRALEHPQLELPDSARWDVHQGAVDERVLAELAVLADRIPVAVTCFRRGHPLHVYGTTRLSAHTVGRAVDIWRIGDRPVVQQQPDGSTDAHRIARQVFDERRISNLGAPWAFDGRGGRSFTDPVHHDHLHLGVSA